jgi:hypothetical protein
MKNYSYGDQVIENAVQEANGWMNTGEATKAVNSAIDALRKVAEYLAQTDFAGMKPEVAARTGAYLAKMVDEIARLVEFSQGKVDSRPDIGVGDLLRVLTNEQFEQFNRWIDEAMASGRLTQ